MHTSRPAKSGKNANTSVTSHKARSMHDGERNEKVTRHTYTGPDYHQKLTTSRESPLAHAYHVWSTSVTAIVS